MGTADRLQPGPPTIDVDRCRSRSGVRGEEGLGLVELVMAITILAFVMLALGAAMGTGLRLVGTNRQRVVAANLASQELEEVRSVPFTDLPLGSVELPPEDVGGTIYTVRRETDWLSQETGAGACAAPGADQDLLSVRVSVSWENMGAVQPIESETVISATSATGSTTTGNLALSLLGGGDQPVGGVTVTLTGPSPTSTVVTSSTGCAHFAGLAPGNYSAVLGHPGFVDTQGDGSPVLGAYGVTAGATTTDTAKFDRAATLSLTFGAPAGRQAPDGLPVTIANTSLQPVGTRVVPGSGNPRTVAGLFPDASGYAVWAGACADADPEGVVPDSEPAQRYYPSANRIPPLQTTPGGTVPGTVALHPVDLTVRRGGVPVAGAPVRAVHADPTACSGVTQPDLVLGSTGADGVLRSALPYGSWRFEVVGAGSVLAPTVPTRVAPGAPVPTVVVVVP